MTNLDSILKSRDITLPTNVHLVKGMVFPGVMHRCESWTVKKAECWRTEAFELWCWRRLFFFFFNFCNLFIYFLFFYFTILYCFCHTLTWIHHRCTWIPNPEPLSHLSPHIISLSHPSAPAQRRLLRRLLRVPWTARRSSQSILKEISPGCSLEGMMLKLKLQYLAASCKELTHWKKLWCWEGLGAEGGGDDRGWDGLMASLSRWTWVWVNSRSWPWTGRPGVLQFMGSQRVGHDWVTELNWTELNLIIWTQASSDCKQNRVADGRWDFCLNN